jgi:uncharacterized protein YjbJ (UPF0337 family)
MKLPIFIAAAAATAVAAYIILNTPGPQAATGSDTLESGARNASQWGSKNRVTGTAGNLVGKLKEGVGNLTGNQDLADEGTGDQIAGNVKDAVGSVAQAAGETLHDLNR